MYKKKKNNKKKTRVHVPAVVWQVFLHTLWQQRHLLSPEIWSQTDPCAPLTHSDHPGGFLSSRGVQMRSPSAAPTSTCRWFMEQCDGYSPEICFCLLSFLRRCGWRKGGEGVKGSRLHSLPDFSSVIHHPHAFIHPPIQPSTPLDMWFFLGTTKKKKTTPSKPCALTLCLFSSTKHPASVWRYLNNIVHSLSLSSWC